MAGATGMIRAIRAIRVLRTTGVVNWSLGSEKRIFGATLLRFLDGRMVGLLFLGKGVGPHHSRHSDNERRPSVSRESPDIADQSLHSASTVSTTDYKQQYGDDSKGSSGECPDGGHHQGNGVPRHFGLLS